MQRVVSILSVFLYLLGTAVYGEELPEKVRIADPFIELHTQPGQGYPVFFVEERGQWITIIKRQTDWFKIRTEKGKIGWVAREQLERTLDNAGEQIKLQGVTQDDFSQRGWELGALWGDASGSDLFTVYGAYAFNANLSVELSIEQMLGSLSTSNLWNVNVVAQAFPDWRYSPYFMIGTGGIRTKTRSTLVSELDTDDRTSTVGLGVRVYLSRSFFLRAEYRELVIFTSTDDNEELKIWSLGVGSFF